MYKNIANYITLSRIIAALVLLMLKPFTILFYIVYIYCGVSDMLDGYVARKLNIQSKIGGVLDSVSDLVFVIVVFIKLFQILDLSLEIVILCLVTILLKLYAVIYVKYAKASLPHTLQDKITGFLLFLFPLACNVLDKYLLELLLSIIAVATAILDVRELNEKNIDC